MSVAKRSGDSVGTLYAGFCFPCARATQVVRSALHRLRSQARRLFQIGAMDGSVAVRSAHKHSARYTGSKCSAEGVTGPSQKACCTGMHVEPQQAPASSYDISTQQTPPATATAQPEQTSGSQEPILQTIKSRPGQTRKRSEGQSIQGAEKKARYHTLTEQQQKLSCVPLAPAHLAEQQHAVLPQLAAEALHSALTPTEQQHCLAVSVEALTSTQQQPEQDVSDTKRTVLTPAEQQPALTVPLEAIIVTPTQQQQDVPLAYVPLAHAQPVEQQHAPEAVTIEILTPAQHHFEQAAQLEAITPAEQQQAVSFEDVASAEQQAVPFAPVTAAQPQLAIQAEAVAPADQLAVAADAMAKPFMPLVATQQQQVMPVKAQTPTILGRALLAHGVLPERVNAFGCQAGQWVADDSIIAVLAAICGDAASPFTHGGQSYELVTCYLNSQDMSVDIPNYDLTTPPERPQCIIVGHTSADGTGQHFSSLIINPEHRLVHAFDSLGVWTDQRVKAVVQGLYPNAGLFGQHAYTLSNNTGKIRQSGATCGPWALWSMVAYVFNYKQCRHKSSDVVDCTLLRGGALAFWWAVTC